MRKRTYILNCPIDLMGISDILNNTVKAIGENKNLQIITINPEMIMNAQKNKKFFSIIQRADMNIPESSGVHFVLNLKGININRIRGIDLARKLIELAAKRNYRIGFLGTEEPIINKAKNNILRKYPSLDVCYCANGYFASDEETMIYIKRAKPQILLVGMGSPRQEEFIYKLKQELEGCVMIGIGGAFDVMSGMVQEAPKIYRDLGMEWLYRTMSQPERFKRIFPLLPMFLIKSIISIITNKD